MSERKSVVLLRLTNSVETLRAFVGMMHTSSGKTAWYKNELTSTKYGKLTL